MGCSSGKLSNNGDYDPHGTALNYLIAGCPSLVANLWDVTDGDIDKLTLRLLEEVGILDGDTDGTCLSEGVIIAREECQLKYLVGSAVVVYGVPVLFV